MEHSVLKGLEGVSPLSARGTMVGYRILEDVSLDFLIAICKQQVKNLDAQTILEDDKKKRSFAKYDI